MLMASGTPGTQRGINLVELMVGIAISLVLLTGVLSVMLRISTSGGEVVASTRLNQQLRGALNLMTRELQRAGYVNWSGANAWTWDDAGPAANPYTADDDAGTAVYNILDFYEAAVPRINDFGQVRLFSFPTPGVAAGGTSACTTNCDCVLYSYDIDGDGGRNTGDFELFGFRWNDGAVEMRTGGDTHSCDSGTWQDITDATINVTNASFSLQYVDNVANGDATVYPIVGGGATGPNTACTPGAGGIPDDKCLWRRKVEISLAGQLASDAAVTMQINTSVKIRNDYLQTAP
jgi:type II secretory pathway pseudopilin PulG